jgi:hypothetical protein
MSGQRHKIDSAGDQYQDFAKVVFGPIAALVEVPRQRDYGIDFFCQLLKPTGPATQTATELFAIQVKGGQERLRYEGVKKGKWKEYQFTWLKSLATPFYLAHVDEDSALLNCSHCGPSGGSFGRWLPIPSLFGLSTNKPAAVHIPGRDR